MKSIILFFAFSLTIYANAKVWRVNNIASFNADFTSFIEAQNNVAPNDTLYFEGSTVSYGDIVINKPLVLIGTGYFLNENPETQSNAIPTQFGQIEFKAGSAGSVITGLTSTSVIIYESNISVISCLLKKVNLNYTANSIENVFIHRNYIYRGSLSGTGDYYSISNLLITNNFIQDDGMSSVIYFGENVEGAIKNNTIKGHISFHNMIVSNNIHVSGTYYYNIHVNNSFYNNICDKTQFPAGNGNQQNVTMTDVFVGSTGNSTDGQWKLKPFSPAIGAGNDDTDCGMFGGASPYVLSGLPSIPAIYEIIMPATGDNINGIDVTIKVKTH